MSPSNSVTETNDCRLRTNPDRRFQTSEMSAKASDWIWAISHFPDTSHIQSGIYCIICKGYLKPPECFLNP